MAGAGTTLSRLFSASIGFALLENRDEHLTPGQFVNVSLALDTLVNAVVVPAEAVQQGPEGAFLFVVRPDSRVEPRKVEVGASDRGLAAISKGIAADETVVTDGQLRLTADTLVHVKPARLEAAPVATATPPAPANPARLQRWTTGTHAQQMLVIQQAASVTRR